MAGEGQPIEGRRQFIKDYFIDGIAGGYLVGSGIGSVGRNLYAYMEAKREVVLDKGIKKPDKREVNAALKFRKRIAEKRQEASSPEEFRRAGEILVQQEKYNQALDESYHARFGKYGALIFVKDLAAVGLGGLLLLRRRQGYIGRDDSPAQSEQR